MAGHSNDVTGGELDQRVEDGLALLRIARVDRDERGGDGSLGIVSLLAASLTSVSRTVLRCSG